MLFNWTQSHPLNLKQTYLFVNMVEDWGGGCCACVLIEKINENIKPYKEIIDKKYLPSSTRKFS